MVISVPTSKEVSTPSNQPVLSTLEHNIHFPDAITIESTANLTMYDEIPSGQDIGAVSASKSANVNNSKPLEFSGQRGSENTSVPPKPSDSEEGSSSKSTPVKPDADTDKDKNPTWYQKLAEKYGSISLENKASVARDHLALERTFLAWLRTSLAFASIGIAITQLFRLNTSLQSRSSTSTPSARRKPGSALPLSPLLGHGLPVELLPYLQQLWPGEVPSEPSISRSQTLLDQLLRLPQTTEAFHIDQQNAVVAARLRGVGKPLGSTFIAVSIIVLFVGFHRYFESQFWIIRGKFPASRGSVALVGLIAGILTIASLVVILVISPSMYERR